MMTEQRDAATFDDVAEGRAERVGEPAPAAVIDPCAPMTFSRDDLEPKYAAIDLGGEAWFLVQATCDAGTKYRNAITRSMRMDAEGKITGTEGLADAEVIAVGACLYRARSNGKGANQLPLKGRSLDPSARAGAAFVRELLDTLQLQLWERLKLLSPGLVPEQKKEPNGKMLTAGSGDKADDGINVVARVDAGDDEADSPKD